jgi:hypothetical protein
MIALSPSWRKALALERLTSDRSDKSTHSQPTPRSFFSNWTPRSSGGPGLRESIAGQRSSRSGATKPQTPFLTLALWRLAEVLPAFEKLMMHPTHDQAIQACALLDASVATAGSPSASPANSPMLLKSSLSLTEKGLNDKNTSHNRSSSAAATLTQRSIALLNMPSDKNLSTHSSPTQRPSAGGMLRNMSPPSPIFPWLSRSMEDFQSSSRISNADGRSRASRQQPTAMILEGEWERWIAPLMLLAAAEVLYHDMYHIATASQPVSTTEASVNSNTLHATALMALYSRIATDLSHTLNSLCNPWLSASEARDKTLPRSNSRGNLSPVPLPKSDRNTSASTSNWQKNTAMANSVSRALSDWIRVCHGRVYLIKAQATLWFGSCSSLSDLDAVTRKNTTETTPASPQSDDLLLATIQSTDEDDLPTVNDTSMEESLEDEETVKMNKDRYMHAQQALQSMPFEWKLAKMGRTISTDSHQGQQSQSLQATEAGDESRNVHNELIRHVRMWNIVIEAASNIEQCR